MPQCVVPDILPGLHDLGPGQGGFGEKGQGLLLPGQKALYPGQEQTVRLLLRRRLPKPFLRSCLGIPEHDTEGRAVTLEFDDHFLVCVYTPNAQDGLKRIDYRMRWEDAFRGYLCELDRQKPVIACGDMNVAHEEIDLKNPKTNAGNAGFSDEERGKFTELLAAGFTDSFRWLYPDRKDAYSWWSYRAAARERNVGWRIDYFVLSDRLRERVKDAYILPEIMGSDHCPVGLDLFT